MIIRRTDRIIMNKSQESSVSVIKMVAGFAFRDYWRISVCTSEILHIASFYINDIFEPENYTAE